MIHLFQTHVASVYLDVAMAMLQIYVLNVSSVFRRILQLFHSSIAKVDLVGLLSEEERASAGAMAASMWRGGAGRATPVWNRRESHPSGVEEAGAKRCGRGGRGASVKETRLSHPGGVGSGAVLTRAREAELARTARESERPGWSKRGHATV
jgi:hypothetical protein